MYACTRFTKAVATIAVCAGLAVQVAAAQSVHIPVGDFSTPGATQAFDHRLEAAERRFCGPRYAPQDLDGTAGCRVAVRAEAMDQLSPDQRRAYAQAHRPPSRLASR